MRWIKRCNRVIGVYPCLRDKSVQALCTDKHHILALSERRIFHHLLCKTSSSTHPSEDSCKWNKTCCSFLEISPELFVMTAHALQLNFPLQNWISPHSTPGICFQRFPPYLIISIFLFFTDLSSSSIRIFNQTWKLIPLCCTIPPFLITLLQQCCFDLLTAILHTEYQLCPNGTDISESFRRIQQGILPLINPV